jgi:glyoxylase-like metal-dependent hydrolase (beta-lactamase superfamily II)
VIATEAPESVAPGIWSIRVPMPYPSNPYVFCYLVEDADGDLHLIDAGLDDSAGRSALEGGLAALGRGFGDIRSVTVTHLHRDHLGVADAVRRAGGAVVGMHGDDASAQGVPRDVTPDELGAWGVPPAGAAELLSVAVPATAPIAVDVLLGDGAPLGIPGRDLVVVHTPGHTTGHVCLVSATDRLVFTGDHLLPDQFAGIGLGGPSAANPIRQYRESLARVREFDGYLALPGHGWAFDTIGRRVDETLAHHGRRTAEVEAVLAGQPQAGVWQIATQLTWSSGWDALGGIYRLSALRQTAWHRELVLDG